MSPLESDADRHDELQNVRRYENKSPRNWSHILIFVVSPICCLILAILLLFLHR